VKSFAWLSLLLCACVTPPLLTCPDDLAYCAGACVDLATDPLSCGACGMACAESAPTCELGKCIGGGSCSAPLTDCAGACVDLSADPAHCGACGNACGAGTTCIPSPGGGASCLCSPGFTGASCSPCRSCTVDEFLVAGYTPFADTQCAPLSICGSAQFELAPPTPISDRACADCAPIPSCLQLVCTNPVDSMCLACAPDFFGPLCLPLPPLPPAPDCYALLQASPATSDGIHLVDPDGPGAIAPFPTYCDMTNGGWTLLNDQDVNVPPGYQDANAWRAGVSTTGPNGGQWGALLFAQAFMSLGGDYELRLTFGQDTTTSTVQWRQTGDPTAGQRGALSSVTMAPAAQASCSGPFAGLADDGVASAAWAGETGCGLAFAVGTSAAVSGGIPAYDSSASGALVTDRVRLWVRVNAP